MNRAGLGRARRRSLLVRIVNDEDVFVRLFVLGPNVRQVRIRSEAAGIDIHHVDGGLAFDDPFRELPAGPARGRDPETVPLVQPDVPEVPCRPNQRTAVRRVGDRAVDDVLDAGTFEAWNALDRRLHVRHQAIEIPWKEVPLETFRNAVPEPCRRPLFVGSQDVALTLFPQVVGGVRFAQHGHFRQPLSVPFHQLRHLIRDDVLVLHRDRRKVDSQHPTGVPAVVAGRADHVLARNVSVGRPDQPLAVRLRFHGRDGGVLVDLGAPVTGTDGHRLRHVGRSDVPVVRMVKRSDQPLRVAQRPERGDVLRRDDLERDTDRVGRTAVLAVLVHPLLVGRESQVSRHMEADILAGLSGQGLVEIDRVLVQLADAVTHVEQREETGGMPRRTCGQLGAFAQDHL